MARRAVAIIAVGRSDVETGTAEKHPSITSHPPGLLYTVVLQTLIQVKAAYNDVRRHSV